MKLAIFLPLGQSLTGQEKSGQFRRFEKYYLQKYREVFNKIYIVSYAEEDLETKRVKVLLNKFNLHRYLWQFLIPFIYKNELKNSVCRVMQLDGLLPALISKLLNGGRVVCTFGYDYKKFALIDNKVLSAVFYFLYEYLLLPFVNLIIVPNPSLYESFQKHWSLKEKLYHAPNGVDTKVFKPRPSLVKKEKIAGKIKLISVGRWEKQKNYPFLIDCIKAANLTKKISLTLISKGSQREFLLSKANKIGLQINLIDAVPNQQMVNYYNSADIYVQPSLIEGSPKAVLEAMACGCCLLVSKAPGNREVVQDGVNGLVADLTIGDFAHKLVYLVDHPQVRIQLEKRARQVALQKYDINLILEKETALLKKLSP